jgi:hypothetical protein
MQDFAHDAQKKFAASATTQPHPAKDSKKMVRFSN